MGLCLLVGCQSAQRPTGSTALRLYLGQQYLLLQEYRNAERNFAKAVSLQPDGFQGWWGLARATAAQGDASRASTYFQRALQKAPENSELLNNYGAFLCALGQYDKAQALFEHGKNTDVVTERGLAHLAAADCYLHQQAPQRAETELQTLTEEMRPKSLPWLPLIRYWKEKQHWQNTALLLRYYHQRCAPSAETLWWMVLVAARQGNQDAIKDYGAMLARNFPHSIQYQRYIANEY